MNDIYVMKGTIMGKYSIFTHYRFFKRIGETKKFISLKLLKERKDGERIIPGEDSPQNIRIRISKGNFELVEENEYFSKFNFFDFQKWNGKAISVHENN